MEKILHERSEKMKRQYKVGIAVLALIGLFLIPDESWAIPAWARKYGVSCGACHLSSPPRLNVMGHRFRKLGYRMPEEIGEAQKYKEIGEYLSMRGRFRYEFERFAKGRQDTVSRFKWNDATLFYGGAVTKNLSTFFEWEWDDINNISLLGQFSWLIGNADRYINFRAGQMHTLTRVGWAGFDRPTGINTPEAISTDITTGGVPFSFNQDQRGIEAAVGLTKDIRIIGQVLNGLNAAGNGTSGSQDDDTNKDFLLAYEQNLTERGSGFTLVGYKGVWHDLAGGTDAAHQFDFYRLGATGSLVFATPFHKKLESELQAGVLYARDLNPPDARAVKDIHGAGYWVGLEQRFDKTAIFARWDSVDPNLRVGKNMSRKFTLGNTYHISDNLRWANEIFVKNKDNAKDSAGFTSEIMFNF